MKNALGRITAYYLQWSHSEKRIRLSPNVRITLVNGSSLADWSR